MKVICILPWKSIFCKASWQGRAAVIGTTRVESSSLQKPGLTHHLSCDIPAILLLQELQRKRKTGTLYSQPFVSLLLSVKEKKSIEIWRWEINKCNYISGYQQQTPDKVATLFWCWGLADSV